MYIVGKTSKHCIYMLTLIITQGTLTRGDLMIICVFFIGKIIFAHATHDIMEER